MGIDCLWQRDILQTFRPIYKPSQPPLYNSYWLSLLSWNPSRTRFNQALILRHGERKRGKEALLKILSKSLSRNFLNNLINHEHQPTDTDVLLILRNRVLQAIQHYFVNLLSKFSEATENIRSFVYNLKG
jgi:hypothetical protein